MLVRVASVLVAAAAIGCCPAGSSTGSLTTDEGSGATTSTSGTVDCTAFGDASFSGSGGSVSVGVGGASAGTTLDVPGDASASVSTTSGWTNVTGTVTVTSFDNAVDLTLHVSFDLTADEGTASGSISCDERACDSAGSGDGGDGGDGGDTDISDIFD